MQEQHDDVIIEGGATTNGRWWWWYDHDDTEGGAMLSLSDFSCENMIQLNCRWWETRQWHQNL